MRTDGRIRGMAFAAVALLLTACTADAGVTATRSIDGTATDGTGPDGTGPDTTDGGATGGSGTIDWGTCDDPTVTDDTLECATLTVPLDHSDPTGDTIDLALVRAPATDTREGAVLFNPGGPGGSGFDPIAINGPFIQRELGLDHFDLVGFDPRGVDRSGGIRCVDDEWMDTHLYLDDTPDTPEEQALLDEADSGFTAGCKERYGDTLKFYSTEATARDMDLIREGMGDDQISYLGISYGTYLGAVYATLFPDRVRAMALDSAYEPNGDTVEQQYLTQLVGFEGAFDDWAGWCQSHDECSFQAPDVGARWDALRLQLDAQPLAGADGRPVNQSTMDVATSAALYSEGDWPVLADALTAAENGDGGGLLSLADAYKGRNADGTFDTLFQSIGIIECASGIDTPPPDDPQALLDKIHAQAPRFGKDVTLDDLTSDSGGCDELMEPQKVVEISYSGKGPIVVVGGVNDPATPIRWAEEMTSALGDHARMITYTGEGHGQLLVSKCVTQAEGAVLADLQLPDPGTTCDPDPPVAKPSWWDDLAGFPDATRTDIAAVKAALGLTDTLGYGETWVTTGSMGGVDGAFTKVITDLGFQDVGSQDLGIDHTTERGFFSSDGDLLIMVVMEPEAFDTDELSSAKGAVPKGMTIVLLAYLPQ